MQRMHYTTLTKQIEGSLVNAKTELDCINQADVNKSLPSRQWEVMRLHMRPTEKSWGVGRRVVMIRLNFRRPDSRTNLRLVEVAM